MRRSMLQEIEEPFVFGLGLGQRAREPLTIAQ
jgi:hypothetical protein